MTVLKLLVFFYTQTLADLEVYE